MTRATLLAAGLRLLEAGSDQEGELFEEPGRFSVFDDRDAGFGCGQRVGRAWRAPDDRNSAATWCKTSAIKESGSMLA
jgi:hypothetical protein